MKILMDVLFVVLIIIAAILIAVIMIGKQPTMNPDDTFRKKFVRISKAVWQKLKRQRPAQQSAKTTAKKIFWRSLGIATFSFFGCIILFYLPNAILSQLGFKPEGIIKEIVAGVIAAGLIGIILGIIFLIQWLAANDLFWTIVKPKTAKIKLTFGGSPKKLEGKVEETGLLKRFFGGIRWLGIPYIHSIHRYKSHWLSFEQKEENGRLVYRTKEEGGDDWSYVSLKDEIYFAVVEGAESADGVPVDIYFQLTLRVTEPLKAIFEVNNWVEAILSLFRPILTDFIREKELTELIGTPRQVEQGQPRRKRLLDEAKEMIKKSKIIKHIKDQYGVIVVPNGFGIAEIVIRDPKYAEALTKDWLSAQEAKRIDREYSAIEARGDTGKMVRTLEALERASEKPSKTVIFPLGGIRDLLGMWIGGGRQQPPNRNRPNRDERRNDR